MDIGRYCYRTDARFFHDDPRTATIRWYIAPEGAKTFQARHCWSQLGWRTAPWLADDVGEVYGAPKTFSRGSTPPTATGQGVFGDEQSFVQGSTFDPEVNVERDRWGLAVQCTDLPDCFILLEDDEEMVVLMEDEEVMLPEICEEEEEI